MCLLQPGPQHPPLTCFSHSKCGRPLPPRLVTASLCGFSQHRPAILLLLCQQD